MASQLLKCTHQCLCLVQCAVSVMLYGNGSAKPIYCHSLMCCVGHAVWEWISKTDILPFINVLCRSCCTGMDQQNRYTAIH